MVKVEENVSASRRVAGEIILFMLCLMTVPISGLHAQQSASAPPSRFREPIVTSLTSVKDPIKKAAMSGVDTMPLPVALSTITTDTGDFAPGHRTYERYLDPRWCLSATKNTLGWLRQTLQAQANLEAVQDMPAKDTLPAEVAAVAKACAAHLASSDTAASNHYGFVRLAFALALGKDAEAQTVLTRLVSDAPTPTKKTQVYLESIDALLEAEPARLSTALSIVTQLDTSKLATAFQRVNAHKKILQFGDLHGDRALIHREAEELILITRSVTGAEFKEFDGLETLWQSYSLLRSLVYIENPDSVPIIGQRLQQDYRGASLRSMIAARCQGEKNPWTLTHGCGPIASLPLDSVMSLLASTWTPRATQSTPLRADFWFPLSGRDTVQPATGVVSIFLHFARRGCLLVEDWCRDNYAQIRRLAAQYGPKRVAFTVIVYAPGYTVFYEPATPAAVAESYRWYLQDYLKLPVTVAVQTMPVMLRLPQPDARVVYGNPTYHDVYSTNFVILTDRDARVVYKIPKSGDRDIKFDEKGLEMIGKSRNELDLDQVVAMVMAESQQPSSPTTSSTPASSSK